MLMYLEGVMKLSPIIVNVLGPTPCTVTVDSQLMRYKRRRNLEVRMVGSGRNQGRTCGPEDLGLRPLAGLIHSIQPDVLCSTLSRFPQSSRHPLLLALSVLFCHTRPTNFRQPLKGSVLSLSLLMICFAICRYY